MGKWNSEGRQWRIALLKRRDGYRCWLCHGKFTHNDPVTIDHAIPKSRSGTNHLHNLRLAHESCNQKRGAIESAKAVPQRASAARLFALTIRREVSA